LAQSDDKARTILLVTKINQLPWEDAGATKAPAKGKVSTMPAKAPASAPAASTASNGEADLEMEAAAAISEVLEKNGGSVAKKALGMQVFRVLGQSPNRSAILNLVASDDFLAQEGTPWNYDGTTVSS